MQNVRMFFAGLVLFAVLVVALAGCEKKKEPVSTVIEIPEIQAEFESFIEDRRTLIEITLLKYGITPSPGFGTKNPDYEKKVDWLRYDVSSSKHNTTGEVRSIAVVQIWGTKKMYGVDVPEVIAPLFRRKDGKWFLTLEGGYIYQLASDDDNKTNSLPPEFHSDFKQIFPYHIDPLKGLK